MGLQREFNYKLRLIDLTDDTLVAHAPTSLTVQLKPDVGKVWEVVNFFYFAPDPAGSAAGSHKIEVRNDGVSSTFYDFRISSNTGTTILASYSTLVGTSIAPSVAAIYVHAVRKLYASNAVPLDIEYTNSTDVDQAGTRQCYVIVKETQEAL